MKNLLILIATILTLTVNAQTETEDINMVLLVNQVRTNPKSIIPAVEAYIESAKKLKALGGKVTNKSNGKNVDVVAEAEALIVFLNNQKPVKALLYGGFIYPFAKSHAQYLDSTRQLSHIGRNGQTLEQRTKVLGFNMGENCGIGKTATDVMVQLLIDLSSPNKGHRLNIFNENYKQMAAAKAGNTWVQDFAY